MYTMIKAYFLSDAHLGSRAMDNRVTHQQHLVRLLEQMAQDATAIYLMGDMFDFWYEYIWNDPDKREYEPFLSTLRNLTQCGIEVHYFIGNHDIWSFGQLEKKTGVIIHRQAEEMLIDGKWFYLAHGDGLVPTDYAQRLPKSMQKRIKRFKQLRAFFHHPVPQGLYRLLPPALGNRFGYEWARRSRMKEFANPCPYKGEDNEELVLFAKEQERMGHHHDFYIFGHRHIELDLMLKSASRVLILGDCFQQWTYAVYQGGELLMHTHEVSDIAAE